MEIGCKKQKRIKKIFLEMPGFDFWIELCSLQCKNIALHWNSLPFSFMKYSTISWEKPTGRKNAVIWESKKDGRMVKLSLKNLWAIYHQTSIR